MSLYVRGLEAGDDPLLVLDLGEYVDESAGEICDRARYAMAERCRNWSPSIGARWDDDRWWSYRRWVHAYALLRADPPGVCTSVQRGSGVPRETLAEVPYPADGELDWAKLFALDLFQKGEDARNDEAQISGDMRRTMLTACKPLGESTWGYRLAGVEPFELREMLAGLLCLPEFTLNGLPADDLSVYAIKWRWSKWESKGCTTLAAIKPVSPKERGTWEAGPPPLFVITINGPEWLLLTEHERMALLHHELCHAKVDVTDDDGEVGDIVHLKPSSLPHDAEVMGYTAMRFGAMNVREAQLIEAAYHNAHTQALLEEARRQALPSPFDMERLSRPPTAEDGHLGDDAPALAAPKKPAAEPEDDDPFPSV